MLIESRKADQVAKQANRMPRKRNSTIAALATGIVGQVKTGNTIYEKNLLYNSNMIFLWWLPSAIDSCGRRRIRMAHGLATGCRRLGEQLSE